MSPRIDPTVISNGLPGTTGTAGSRSKLPEVGGASRPPRQFAASSRLEDFAPKPRKSIRGGFILPGRRLCAGRKPLPHNDFGGMASLHRFAVLPPGDSGGGKTMLVAVARRIESTRSRFTRSRFAGRSQSRPNLPAISAAQVSALANSTGARLSKSDVNGCSLTH
ncbi:hypothetical protein Pan181_14770 [Aeoliella mucimassa]|uniref:Uncharacterized protein n=1 Tax=Aeoliella mucimassa TaxID=2527972 RepID=A0A518AKM2_9BACT|nr:hypothetical protein Pan181_14770 [Aeoliella mucimassa]